MLSKNTIHAYANGSISPLEQAQREEKRLGTNCVRIELMSFKEGDRVIRVVVKKSRLDASMLESVRQEYRTLRHHLGDIIPMQAFIEEKCSESDRQMISAFCAPVTIAYDIFASDQNFEFLKRELENNPELQNEINFFVTAYQHMLDQGFVVDLYGDENLVITREGRLKYIDSFLVNMASRKSLRAVSEARFKKLKSLSTVHDSGG